MKLVNQIQFKLLLRRVHRLLLVVVLPLLIVLFAPVKGMEYWLYGFTIIFLVILGVTFAKTGGSSIKKSVIRLTIWGTIAMVLSALMGYIFGVKV